MPPKKSRPTRTLKNATNAAIARAQDLVYQSLDTEDPEAAEALLSQALELDPECTEAQLILLEGWGGPMAARVPLLEAITAQAAARLGPTLFRTEAGHFWHIHETRPYMRASYQLALAYTDAGDEAAAAKEYRELLRLCPDDNLGARYPLVGLYLALGQLKEASTLLDQHEHELSGPMCWARVLEQYLVGGANAAMPMLQLARAWNQRVERFLAAREPLPWDIPDSWTHGSEEEAIMVARDLGEAYRRHPEAVVWLRSA